MSNIAIRNEKGSHVLQTPTREWDPMRWMHDILRWDPFRQMAPTWVNVNDEQISFVPTFEIKETKEGFVFKADLPGVKDKDLDITLTGNRLTVTGKREAEREEKTDTYYMSERSYGSFARAFTLPEGADVEKVRADLKDGVLTVMIARKPELQPKKISVQSTTKNN